MLLTVDDLVEISHLAKSTIYRLVSEGRIPAIQPAGKHGKLLFEPDVLTRLSAAGSRDLRADHSDRPNGKLSGPSPRWMAD